MVTNVDSIQFNYNDIDKKLFLPEQHRHWINIQKDYISLKKRVILEVQLPQSGAHRDWIISRVNLHISQSLMRLLYLVEDFSNCSSTFNSVGATALVKSIAEIPLHFGYILWILTVHGDFEKIRNELGKIAFGNRDPLSGLTTSSKITHKELYTKSDQMMDELFKDSPSTVRIFERLYKDSNATGHHNYEARMLTGIQNGDIWKAGDRKELFVFFSNNVFQFFMHCAAALGLSIILLKAIDHYLDQLPDNFPNKTTGK